MRRRYELESVQELVIRAAEVIRSSKPFVVDGGKRNCLVCDRMFTLTQAADHATTPCHTYDAERRRGKL